jgi:hypothetical protein
MIMNSKNSIPNISYYRLSLLAFLHESHPERLSDNRFIIARSEMAAETYTQAIKNGNNAIEAEEQANGVLFQGLHFSRHDTLVNILWNEFSDAIPEDEAKDWAIRLLHEQEAVFAQYPLSDDFADDFLFDLLYTELTGAIALYMEEHGLQ